MTNLEFTNRTTRQLLYRMEHPEPVPEKEPICLGVDIGTANVVTVAVDAKGNPLGGKREPARVVREGMIVNYLEAVRIVSRQVEELRNELCHELVWASSSFPPKTEKGNIRVTGNILEAAGLMVADMEDEPTAAAAALKITDGAVVDVGGGTTGVSILRDGKVVMSDDEATGGFHFDLVIAGGMKIPVEEAEQLKRDPEKQKMLFPVVRPVMEKVCSIIDRMIRHDPVDAIYLAGGSCAFYGFADLIEKNLGIRVFLPEEPLYVTPLGIALTTASRLLP